MSGTVGLGIDEVGRVGAVRGEVWGGLVGVVLFGLFELLGLFAAGVVTAVVVG